MTSPIRYLIPVLGIWLSACGQAGFVAQRTAVQDDIIAGTASAESGQALNKIPDIRTFQFRLFRQLNQAGLFFFRQEYDSSLARFSQAEATIEDQYTRRVSQEASSLVTNQYSVNYQGYPVEHLLVHFFKSLIYLGRNDVAGAAVEVRKLQQKLDFLEQKGKPYEIKRTDFRLLNEYSAWISWLNGDENDARVNFRLAGADFDSLKSSLPAKNRAHIVVHLNGLVAELQEAYIRLILTTDSDIHTLKVAFPVVFDPFIVQPSVLNLKDQNTRSAGMDVNGQFTKELEISEKELSGKAMARVATKFVLAEMATNVSEAILDDRERDREKQKEKGEKVDEANWVDGVLFGVFVAGNIMKVTNDVTEKADLRQWFTLPGSITISLRDSQPDSTSLRLLMTSDRVTVYYQPPVRTGRFNESQYQRTETLDFSGKTREELEKEEEEQNRGKYREVKKDESPAARSIRNITPLPPRYP
ncbi:MAG: hypothetical protein L6Q77_14860 [Bacteroidetes bacterium]|nr:hypothetical protein [Bacteroidota bacterium]